jgi:hypothetical protein
MYHMRRRIHVSYEEEDTCVCLYVSPCLSLYSKITYQICISNMHIKYAYQIYSDFTYRICISNMHIKYAYRIYI